MGNCASSLVQGVEFYKDAPENEPVPGLMHVNLGGYHVRDIEFTAAFDIDRNKVGRDLSEAIFAEPNNTYRFSSVPELGVKVHRGMTHDGIGKYVSSKVEEAPGMRNVKRELQRSVRAGVWRNAWAFAFVLPRRLRTRTAGVCAYARKSRATARLDDLDESLESLPSAREFRRFSQS